MSYKRKFKLALFTATVFFSGIFAAYGHGDAEWIEKNPEYVDSNNIHCCGVHDCEKAPVGAIVATKDGYFIPSTGQSFPRPEEGNLPSGSHWSIDQDFWWCIVADMSQVFGETQSKTPYFVKCIFTPQPVS
jgi:hypothetical protein